MPNLRPVALYARVSSSNGRQRPDSQLDALRAYAARRGVPALEFLDEFSGALDRRTGLDALLAAARRREISAVVATKLDRIGRSVRHLCALAEEFRSLGVDLVVLDQAIDTATPVGQLVFPVLGAIAEFERALIRERVRAGLEAAKRRGRRLGRPPIVDRDARVRIRRLRASGHSLRAIAAQVGVSLGSVTCA